MSITNKSLEKAISSTEAAKIRGKLGIEKGNKFIQEIHNKLHHGKGSRHSGYD